LFEFEVLYDSDISRITINHFYQCFLIFKGDSNFIEFPVQLKIDTIPQLRIGLNEGFVEALEEEYNQCLLCELLEKENNFLGSNSKLTRILKTYLVA
jgi:hypothetical protein